MEERLASNPLYSGLTWIALNGWPREEGNYIVYYEYGGYTEDDDYGPFVTFSRYDKCEGFTNLEMGDVPFAYIAIEPYAFQILEALKEKRRKGEIEWTKLR